MTIQYEVIETLSGGKVINATFTDSERMLSIPMDESNSDYQAYLATLASELSNPSTSQAGE
jgi:hypothetical protein